jgi:hypothetical protein
LDFNRSLPEPTHRPPAVAPAAIGRHVNYLEAASLTQVMFDQLEYLVAHAGGNCALDCADCERLQQVKSWLLLPFRPAGE